MSTNHTATLPDGTTVTRTSKGRVYSHAVAIQKPAAKLQAEVQEALDYNEKRYIPRLRADLARLVAGEATHVDGHRFLLREGKDADNAFFPTRVEEIERYDGADGYIAKAEAAAQACRDLLTAGDFQDGEWGCAGWQSRRDLAEKEAARWLKSGWRAVIIDNVEQTVKATKAAKKGS